MNQPVLSLWGGKRKGGHASIEVIAAALGAGFAQRRPFGSAVEAGRIARADVTQLGDVLAGTAQGRRDADEITVFDSTGLAIQDLAIALAAMERADELDLPTIDL